MAVDIQIYCNCMERVRRHVSIADQVFAGKIDTQNRDLNTELIFLHFRKALEEIAFASLSANREKYSAARAGFATEWNARRMLGFVGKVNPNFYPIPLKPPQECVRQIHDCIDREILGDVLSTLPLFIQIRMYFIASAIRWSIRVLDDGGRSRVEGRRSPVVEL